METVKVSLSVTEVETREGKSEQQTYRFPVDISSYYNLFMNCIREFGRCTGRWFKNGEQVGWKFTKKMKYDNGSESWIEAWVEIGKNQRRYAPRVLRFNPKQEKNDE